MRPVFLVAAVAVCMGILIFWATRHEGKRGEVPDYLFGRWISSAPAYQDRYLEVNEISLIFATGEATVAEYFITNIAATPTAHEVSFTIECKDMEGNSHQFQLIYLPDNGGTLFFKNKPNIKWLKNPADA